MKKSYITAVVIATVAIIWVMSGVLVPPAGQNAATAAKIPDKERAEVRVRTSNAEQIIGDIVVTGRTAASRAVMIKAETEGRITEIVREEGAFAEDGAVIARIEKREREARLAEARERLVQREIEYKAAWSLQSKGLNSKVRLAQAKADLEQARAEIKRAEIDLANTEITAPFKGVLYEQRIEIGDYVAVGDTLFGIVDLDPIAVRGFVTEQQVQELKAGQIAQAEFIDGSKAQGTITYIAPSADPATRTFAVEISIPNAAREIVAGMTAELRIPTTEKKVHKISPAVLSLNDEGAVGIKYVDSSDTVRFAPVKILADFPDHMLVGGLPEQLRLITVGQDFVVPGQRVKAVAAEGDGLL